jgi:hypothetical protein
MPEPATILGVKMSTAVAIGGGSVAATILMPGDSWKLRFVAGACGAICAFVMTPLVTPLAFKAWAMIFSSIGAPVEELSRDSVAGFVGFVCALTGIDICRFLIDRTKGGLKIVRLPWMKGDRGK